MAEKFPSPYADRQVDDEFGTSEVGITHPEVPGFIRIKDTGDIEIVAGEGLAIVMNPHSRSITFVADSIKFLTRGEEGLRWNKWSFNDKSIDPEEPTLVEVDDMDHMSSLYFGADYYYDLTDLELPSSVRGVDDEL